MAISIVLDVQGVPNSVGQSNPLPVRIKDGVTGDDIDIALALKVAKALEELTYDLNAAPYSDITVHSGDYNFVGIFLKFSSAESKTITLYLKKGSVEIPLWVKTTDIGTSRVWVPDNKWALPEDWELKLTITQTAGACNADILLLTSN